MRAVLDLTEEIGLGAAEMMTQDAKGAWGVAKTPGDLSRGPAGLQSLPYLLKESLERLWNYRYRGAMLNYLNKWMGQLKWQRLVPFEKLAETLLKHVDGIANYCETKVRFGVVEAVTATFAC